MIDTVSVSTFSMQPISGHSAFVTSRGLGTGSPLRAIDATRSSAVRRLRIANRASLVAILPSVVGRRVGGARGYSSLGQRSRRPQRQDDSRGLVPRVGLLRHGFVIFPPSTGRRFEPPDRGSRASVITVPSQAHQFLVETGSSSEHPRACGWRATPSERCRTAHRQLVSPPPQSNRRAETFRQTSPRRGHPPGAVSSRRRH